jgi:hypothetical protein
MLGRGSSVGIATRYRLVGSGLESRCGAGFSALFHTDPGPTQFPIRWLPGIFPRENPPERDVGHPVELYV